MEHRGQLIVPQINRVKVMPYWPGYADWIDHLNGCAQCATVMTQGSQLIEELCTKGAVKQTDLGNQLRAQTTLAALN